MVKGDAFFTQRGNGGARPGVALVCLQPFPASAGRVADDRAYKFATRLGSADSARAFYYIAMVL